MTFNSSIGPDGVEGPVMFLWFSFFDIVFVMIGSLVEIVMIGIV